MTFPVVIFHNPACGTSRNVLAAIRAAGHEPEVIDYLTEGWTAPMLRALFAAAGITARQALRLKGTEAEALGLTEADAPTIIAAMVADPMLVNRPLVATPRGVRLVRPSERIAELLDRPLPAGLTKEDGTPLA